MSFDRLLRHLKFLKVIPNLEIAPLWGGGLKGVPHPWRELFKNAIKIFVGQNIYTPLKKFPCPPMKIIINLFQIYHGTFQNVQKESSQTAKFTPWNSRSVSKIAEQK